MNILTVITILTAAYVVQVLSNKFPSGYKPYSNEPSDGLTESRRTKVDFSIFDAVLQDRTSGQMITWNPLYQDSTSLSYKELSATFCQLIVGLVTNVMTPGSNMGRCGGVIFSQINIHSAYDGVIIGVKAKSSLHFLYPNEHQLNMDSIMTKLKADFRHSNKLSFLKIMQLTAQAAVETMADTIPSQQSKRILPPMTMIDKVPKENVQLTTEKTIIRYLFVQKP
ncbi:unnamed protein product [Schistosoma turkestanicum]|nr:unnamed protein product [Schistosoma turkestanicum]